MIFVVLNIILSLSLVWLFVYLDQKSEHELTAVMKESIFFLFVYSLSIAATVHNSLNYHSEVAALTAKIAYGVLGCFCVNSCFYVLQFPNLFTNKRAVFFARVVLYLLCFNIVFTKIIGVECTDILGLEIRSPAVLSGKIGRFFAFTWIDLYLFVLVFGAPILSIIIMLLKNEKENSKLNFQRSVMNVIAFMIGLLLFYLIRLSLKRVPLFSTLYSFPLVAIQIGFTVIFLQKTLFDWRSALGAVLGLVLRYVIPSMVVAFGFIFMWNLRSSMPALFAVLNLLLITLALTVSYQTTKLFGRIKFFAREKYGSELERDLPLLNFDFEPDEVMEQMKGICMTDVGMKTMRVLIDNGVDAWESAFDNGEKHLKIDHKNPVIESFINQNKTIILKNTLLTSNVYKVNKEELLKLFEETESEVIILLNEGRHILGMLFFGPKLSGNVYSEYDLEVFSKLYSYFFVFGYYMKNIANQSIVGTVNREIKMSAQLITSIQENIDRVKNPAYDIGYLMTPAHNIGGEYIDLIRLSDDKHIFVQGDLSGKGISASMSMVITKSIIRGFLNETKDFKILVQKVNSFIRYNLPKGTFFEGVFGLIDFAQNKIYYINCGVPALFLYTRSFNNVIEVQGEGRVLGFASDVSKLVKVKKLDLNPGDIVCSCTDGLLDATSLRSEKFGKERVQKTLIENSTAQASAISRTIYNNMKEFISKDPEEDVSILVIRYKGK